MSGPTNPSQAPQAAPHASGSETTIAADDAAASLRAAALLTLKSNRRKAHTGIELPASLPPRPMITETPFELDYGTEEPSTGTSSKPQSSPAPAVTKLATLATSEPMDVDEGQGREEGEISDNESTMPPQASSRSVPPQAPPKARSPSKDRPSKSPIMPPPSLKADLRPNSLPDTQIKPPAHLGHLSPSFDNTPMLIDEDHIRPGLSMSQAQYDTAKDIVLDLLGWGVPPEYLVNCGLSREIVYYVFIELNLRLPSNLDLSGLPRLESTYVTGSPEPITPPATRSPRRCSSSSTARPHSRPVQGHPSLPQKPTAPQGTDEPSSQTHLNVNATPFVPTASTSAVPMSTPDSPPSLIDIEQQRRQELLARKAVLASRKSKLATAAPNTNTPTSRRPTIVAQPEPKDVEMMPTVPTETVDSFLSTIPAVSVEASSASFGDEMDVDAIPGLSMNGSGFPEPDPPQQLQSRTPSIDALTSNNGHTFHQPEASSSGQSTRDPSMERAGERSASVDDKSDSSNTNHRRRTSRRPVAADFVDMAPGSSLRIGSKHDRTAPGPYPSPVPRARRRPQSFAGLTRAKRIVIDLSDSEDDVEGASDSNSLPRPPQFRPPSRLGAAATVPQIGSPSLLLEKELEIRRMKELIAARERAIKGKLTAVGLTSLSGIWSAYVEVPQNSNRSTPPLSVGGSSPAPPLTVVKQEEDDSTAAVSLKDTPTTLDVPRAWINFLDLFDGH
ncbi:hypothetical protein EIP86_006311 [Pleurotus ostreatoroseus]|nr:hypothetical protein EIP86_006311 [Pleurotus ostreatoroseus]